MSSCIWECADAFCNTMYLHHTDSPLFVTASLNKFRIFRSPFSRSPCYPKWQLPLLQNLHMGIAFFSACCAQKADRQLLDDKASRVWVDNHIHQLTQEILNAKDHVSGQVRALIMWRIQNAYVYFCTCRCQYKTQL